MKTLSRFLFSAAVASALLFSLGTTHGQLLNGGFESGLSGWTTFGNAYADPAFPHTGVNGLKLFGNWSGAWNASGAFQNLPITAGSTVTLEGFGLNPGADPVAGGNQNFALMKIIWFDGPNGTGNMLQPLPGPGALFGANPGVESGLLNNATPLDAWVPLFASGEAPAGTQSVQIMGGLFLQPNFEGGSLWLDDITATITIVPEPTSLSLLGLALAAGILLRRRSDDRS